MKTEYVNWCRQLFDSLNDGGKWIVPRSGLVYRKLGDSLHLIERLPDYDESLQESDVNAIAVHFGAAGISVQ